ncbi:hypothetical protein HYH03_014429 [Edaphochlamys debaryana]|uniref:Uncharacterized protein n=1 Tax=Edaphochlamys debaryana TaxID=47281 RepID=A0A835XNV6_9CHLO|nr:hypothetical protein HYH03_014429 [Edaphochlamys debaryana]|eukprot:KAG2486930.1 hypothetical protein HYH03_014429 [Edaphochlamys debaryana]
MPAVKGKARPETKDEARARKEANRKAHEQARWVMAILLGILVAVGAVIAYMAAQPPPLRQNVTESAAPPP